MNDVLQLILLLSRTARHGVVTLVTKHRTEHLKNTQLWYKRYSISTNYISLAIAQQILHLCI